MNELVRTIMFASSKDGVAFQWDSASHVPRINETVIEDNRIFIVRDVVSTREGVCVKIQKIGDVEETETGVSADGKNDG